MIDPVVKYIHSEIVHNTEAPNQIVPYIIELINPKSVVDVGCGLATWLKVFEEHDVHDILGIDGHYVNKALLKVDSTLFEEHDLETPYYSRKRYDLALSLEVAEHLKVDSANIIVQSLVSLSDVVIFSAAIVNQGGQNHINEQNPDYWIKKFGDHGYHCLDILRPVFWNNSYVEFWYKQNMFIFTNRQELIEYTKDHNSFHSQTLVHPDLLKIKDEIISKYHANHEKITYGYQSSYFYLKLILKKIFKKGKS